MPFIPVNKYIIGTIGGTVSIDSSTPVAECLFTTNGNIVALTSNFTLGTVNTPLNGSFFRVIWDCQFDTITNNTSVTVLGKTLTDGQAATKGIIIAYYNTNRWDVNFLPDFFVQEGFIQGSQLEDNIVINPANNSIHAIALNSDVAGLGLVQNVSGALDVNVDTSTIVIASDTLKVKTNSISEDYLTSSVAGAALDGGNGAPLAVKVDNSSIAIISDQVALNPSGVTNTYIKGGAPNSIKYTDPTGAVADLSVGINQVVGRFLSDLQAINRQDLSSGDLETVNVLISFETGEQAFQITPIGYAYNIKQISISIVKDIEATDNATIEVISKVIGPNSYQAITILAGTTNASQSHVSSTLENSTELFGSYYSLTLKGLKNTGGGKAFVSLIIEKI